MRSLPRAKGFTEMIDLAAQRVDDGPSQALGNFMIALHVLPRQSEIADNGAGQSYFETTDRAFQAAACNDHGLWHGPAVAMVCLGGGIPLHGSVFEGAASHYIVDGVGWNCVASICEYRRDATDELWNV